MNRPLADQLSVLACPIKSLPAFEDAALKTGLVRNPGIKRVDVSRLEDTVRISYDPSAITEEQVRSALNSPDYLVQGFRAPAQRLLARYGLAIRLVGSALLFAGALLAGQGHRLQPVLLGGLFLLSLPAFIRCLTGLFKKGRFSADLLVWIIAAAALGMGRWMEASGVIFLSVFADFLRQKAFQPARLAGANEDALLARLVTIREGDTTREVSLADIQKDQVVLIRQGQMVPVDGQVLGGKAEIHDAALTGESKYQTKSEGDAILAGTMVESGSLEIKVLRAGKDTLLASVDRLVNRALLYTDKTNRFMDRFIRAYVSLVGIFALLVFAFFGQHTFWSSNATPLQSFQVALAVLLGACPLALVLTGPLTLYAGLLRAARGGVLFKGGDVLEKLAAIRVLLLDKTGTLTYAKPKVSRIKAFRGFTKEQVLEAALFVERQSSHPIARTICEYGEAVQLDARVPDKFLEFEGGGACAIKGDYYIKVGALWLMEDGRDMEPEALDWMAEVKAQGLSFVLVANRTRLLGGLVLEDALRENARDVVGGLRNLGLNRLIMITGDNRQTAESVKEAVGLDEVEAECMPDRKLVRIQDEKRKGHAVGMIGDGINDAPALAAADVGIAMGTHSSDLAVEASDVALVNNDLYDLYFAVAISQLTMRFIKINAILAVVGNLVLIALSIAGLITLVGGIMLQAVMLAIVALMSAVLYIKKIA